jgi:hypothetical protein
MLVIDIPSNPNCAPADLRIFNDLEPARAVRQVRLSLDGAEADRWYDVTGWSASGAPVPALARKVDDSGDGVALLVSGGDAGLRLRPAGDEAAWRLDDASQRGVPFLLIAEAGDLRFE